MTIILKYFYVLIALLIAFIKSSCAQSDDFKVPEPEPTFLKIPGIKITIATLKNQFSYQTEEIITFSNTKNYIEGYVVSSDEAGNFFKELVVQDLPKNPASGIQVLIDQRSLYQKYTFGRKVFIQLDGLSLGLDHGVLKLGKLQENTIKAISGFEIEKYVFRTEEIKEVVPRALKIEDFDRHTESLYVILSEMQFAKEFLEEPSGTLAGATTDRFQGERELHSCTTQASLILSTSVYADFKLMRIPVMQGSVSGIVSKDFFGKYYVLRMNTTEALAFDKSPRCEMDYLLCKDVVPIKRSAIVFEEDFENITKNIQLEQLGWVNYNSNGDVKRWENKKIRNVANRVMTISAYNTKLNPLEAWLITPEIDLDQTTDEVISFDVNTSFNNGKILSVLATTDYSGTPETTNWRPLDIIIPQKTANKVRISDFPISCLDGKVRLAFRYNGRDPGATSTYNLDNVLIHGVLK